MVWPSTSQAITRAATGSVLRMGELPATPSRGSSTNITVKPVP